MQDLSASKETQYKNASEALWRSSPTVNAHLRCWQIEKIKLFEIGLNKNPEVITKLSVQFYVRCRLKDSV